jgi:hypothetical protein
MELSFGMTGSALSAGRSCAVEDRVMVDPNGSLTLVLGPWVWTDGRTLGALTAHNLRFIHAEGSWRPV